MNDLILGVDWGTSNRRAYLVDRHGACLKKHADGAGVLAVREGFAASLDALREAMRVDRDVPVVMSGMVGSASGWREVAYLDITVPLDRLPMHLAPIPGAPGCRIAPGYRIGGRRGELPRIDVMRGEETQLLGAVALGIRSGTVVLPGTHSKWVALHDARIECLRTAITGELFALLRTGGTLAPLMTSDAVDDAAFIAGLELARGGEPLTQALFEVRARVVTGAMPAAHVVGMVSGLLIGTEFAAQGRSPVPARLHIIGSDGLSSRYAQAAGHFGMQADVLDPDRVYVAALVTILEGVIDATA
jgi:2-dehydro-3-deoxygalactonokinase